MSIHTLYPQQTNVFQYCTKCKRMTSYTQNYHICDHIDYICSDGILGKHAEVEDVDMIFVEGTAEEAYKHLFENYDIINVDEVNQMFKCILKFNNERLSVTHKKSHILTINPKFI